MSSFDSDSMSSVKRIALPILLIIFCTILMIWVTWFINTTLSKSQTTPESTSSHTIILIDQTDALSERCLMQLETLLEELPQTIKKGERLSIFSIHSNSDIAITPLLSVYNPGLGSNEWIENIKMKRDQFVESFMKPIVEFSTNMKSRPPSPSSPIIETVNRILSWNQFSAKTRNRKLIIYSDMLQNSVNCSDYRESKIVYKGSPGCPPIKPMDRVMVDIRYILRPKYYGIQTIEHQAKWKQWFRDAGATITLERII